MVVYFQDERGGGFALHRGAIIEQKIMRDRCVIREAALGLSVAPCCLSVLYESLSLRIHPGRASVKVTLEEPGFRTQKGHCSL
jgi:hypothetical protein